ncbi:MAG: DUF2267 domain-containing protein [Terriglobales bacterium]
MAYRLAPVQTLSVNSKHRPRADAQLPELLRGVFYESWNPSRVPGRYGYSEYVTRFAREARIHESDVAKATGVVTAVVRLHMTSGAVDEALALLPTDLRELLEPGAAGHAAPSPRT